MSIDKDYLKYLEQFVTDKRKNLFREVLSNRTRHFAVVLEDLYQKHNTSAVTRSCEVFGVQDLYTIENKYKTYVSAHVGKGSHKWLHFNRFKTKNFNTTDCLEDLRAKGYQIVATSPHHHSIELADLM